MNAPENPWVSERTLASMKHADARVHEGHFMYYTGGNRNLIEIEEFSDGSATLRIVLGDFELGCTESTSCIVTIKSASHLKEALNVWINLCQKGTRSK